jgi:hypothetical protein
VRAGHPINDDLSVQAREDLGSGYANHSTSVHPFPGSSSATVVTLLNLGAPDSYERTYSGDGIGRQRATSGSSSI